VRVHPERCVGHGRCYELAPEVYGEDERGHCRIARPAVPRELEARARLGAEACPESAIAVEEEADPGRGA
jgi:ferredoxin